MFWKHVAVLLTVLPIAITAFRYDPEQVKYNLNENKTATHPADYWGEWDNHTYHPSPDNWRFPFYIITLDRYVDGDPTNNEANETVFEHNWMSNQFRFGGDVKGLQNDLDYIQGIGIKALYIAGSPFINMPWSGDGYGPLDFTLLDRHHGTIEDWRNLITEIHRRDMYVVFDNTMATMGNLLAFQGYVNASAPFNWDEYDYLWKTERRYHDFQPGNTRNESCEYPRMWGQDGYPLTPNITQHMQGCRDSEFDMYGDIKGTGAYPSYRNELSKFASVQDRLREWRGDVLEKIKVMSCMQIAMFDIDGFRMDKGLQTTPDAMAEFASYQRECGRKHGKENFLMVGEIVGAPELASVFVGRGKQPDMYVTEMTKATGNNVTEVVMSTNATHHKDNFIRQSGNSALDGAAFHYDVYGAMTRFLGLDGPWGARGVDWVEQWTTMVSKNDMVNANTGKFDPRHMFGMTNQDVFRWPSLKNGTQRQLLGFMITMLEMPGMPMILWGEEQEYYILENLANDYVFGRTPMASSRAWQLHGCYNLSEQVYVDMPFDSSGYGCFDDKVSLDHRDSSHPVRNVLKRIFELRRQYPVLNDGFNLVTLSKRIYNIYLPGSGGLPSPHGIWSVFRGRVEAAQDFTGIGKGNTGIWFIYQNENKNVNYSFDCQSRNSSEALVSPYPAGTTVKNLFYPYEEYTLEASTFTYGFENSTKLNGCIPQLETVPWGWKVLVPKEEWATPAPTITRVVPGHDSRLQSTVSFGQQESVAIQIRFSSEMSCESVTNSLEVESTTQDGHKAFLNKSSVVCTTERADLPLHVGEIATAWMFNATIENVSNGVHTYAVRNASTEDGKLYTNAVDRFMFRIGQSDNPIVFPSSANYTRSLLHKDHSTGDLYISPRAPGADKFRYSLNWGSSYSPWEDYTGANTTLTAQSAKVWSGTSDQEWTGDHVIVHYWSRMTGSSDHVQHADLGRDKLPPRRWPHAFLQGSWNQYGYDGGLPNEMKLESNGLWTFSLVAEWPTELIVNVWGMNPDGYPDKSQAFGDVDGDFVLDWLPPDSLARNVIKIPDEPSRAYLGYEISVNDGTYHYYFTPVGSTVIQTILAVLLGVIPLITGILGTWSFKKSFYQVKFNEVGITEKTGMFGSLLPAWQSPHRDNLRNAVTNMFSGSKVVQNASGAPSDVPVSALAVETGSPDRRTVLIATMEYEIEDWNIKIKIGGLGVMASLMGKNLGHQDLIWVVPCIGGIEYPTDFVAEPMSVVLLGRTYEVNVQYHQVRNITFVLLDAPVFRKQTKADPYPARMDDLDSAIYYSSWNQCIAQAFTRFSVNLYHINDYHGAVAPLHLLPQVIPCCLSLHNAEFQGMWSLRTKAEMDEICKVYNLPKEVVAKYVQFGEVFNLLHAGASYLRIHQKGFGAVGVSKKYGVRALMRYPIFWGLHKIGALPNPDPTDTAAWDKALPKQEDIVINSEMEANRGNLRREAQEWAGLKVDPEAELFVFVGRWSNQKGVDLIADVFFSILEEHPKVQLICVGPVIDLYGKFAALKLAKMMHKFPGRVYSKPEFTALPTCIFSGAEFALIPSRDEPFGLVAVEFGRKGALGVGSRVGGLGQMPGWWFTIESTTSRHLLQQFKTAIREALACKTEVRAMMRARSLIQRFPVAQWIEDLEKLQSTSIRINLHQQQSSQAHSLFRQLGSGWTTPTLTTPTTTAPNTTPNTAPPSREGSRAPSPTNGGTETWSNRQSLMSQIFGPGHSPTRGRNRLTKSNPHSRSSSHTSFQGGEESNRNSRDVAEPAIIVSSDEGVEASSHRSVTGNAPRVPSRLQNQVQLLSPLASPNPSAPGTPSAEDGLLPNPFDQEPTVLKKRLSVNSIIGQQKDFNLQKVDPFFTDSENLYYGIFDKKLNNVDAKSSEDELCIEEYLVKSEKQWFSRFHRAKLGMSSRPPTPTSSVFRLPWGGDDDDASSHHEAEDSIEESPNGEFLLGDDYTPPGKLRNLLQRKIGDWQLYCFFLAFGQIIAANSYQITLLTGENGQAAEKLYIIASIYLGASIFWWFLYRAVKSVYVLSLPFVLYGIAFFILGMGPYVKSHGGRGWLNNAASGIYSFASASGSFYFALNFGTEGGTPAESWAFRACVIQGTQQIYVAFLWYWGSTLTKLSTNGVATSSLVTSGRTVTAITTPVAGLMWTVAVILFFGLPQYYRQKPGKVPSFYKALFRRRIVVWFFIMVLIQNYFLSAPYGRNWRYLWSSQHAPTTSIIALLLTFFVVVWALALLILGRLSTSHSWILPIFAISLGAPRWAQELWGTSNIGLYIPWGSRVTGALLGRCLWLWLGVLDALQGVGFGMILLQTLTRFHVSYTLVASQVIGSVATMVARATAPDRVGPGSVFPNFALGIGEGLSKPWFWVALLFQLVICVGFFKFFRKEQLFKP